MALLAAIPAVALLNAIAVHAPDPLTFFTLPVPVGLVIGCVAIIVTVEADRVEYLVGYRIMNRSNVFWNISVFSAGLFGADVASLGVNPQMHPALNVPAVVVGIKRCLWN